MEEVGLGRFHSLSGDQGCCICGRIGAGRERGFKGERVEQERKVACFPAGFERKKGSQSSH